MTETVVFINSRQMALAVSVLVLFLSVINAPCDAYYVGSRNQTIGQEDAKALFANTHSGAARTSDSVFNTYAIGGNSLPNGCWVVKATTFEDGRYTSITLTSTSEWLFAQNVKYTHGIVVAEVNEMSIPVSINGAEIRTSDHKIDIRAGVQGEYQGKISLAADRRSARCIATSFTASELRQFKLANLFLKSLFTSISPGLPNWFRLQAGPQDSMNSIGVSAKFVYGHDVEKDEQCRGAPLFADHLYGVFKFGSHFSMYTMEKILTISELNIGERFCLIIDLSQQFGESTFFMLPPKTRSIMSEVFLSFFGFSIIPRGFGISATTGINVHYLKNDLTLWNGQRMFTYPVFQQANLWVGCDFGYTNAAYLLDITAETDFFLSAPKIKNMLRIKHSDEMNGLLSIRAAASIGLKFELFGEQIFFGLRDISTHDVDLYMSVGGKDRVLCREIANPQGIFLSAVMPSNPFRKVEILKELKLIQTSKAYAYFMPSQYEKVHRVDIYDKITTLQTSLQGIEFIVNTTFTYENISSTAIAQTLRVAGLIVDIRLTLDDLLPEIRQGNPTYCVDAVDEIVKMFLGVKVELFNLLDISKLFAEGVFVNTVESLHNRFTTVERNMNEVVNNLNNQLNSRVTGNDGFGMKFQANLKLLNIEIGKMDIEVLYSRALHSSCDSYNGAFELLKDEPAARFLARAEGGTQLVPFIKLKNGRIKMEMAFAIHSHRFQIRTQVWVNIFGSAVATDLFIYDNMIRLNTDVNVWNLFHAHIGIEAKRGQYWHELAFKAYGKFIAKGPSADNSFEQSYLGALQNGVNLMSDEVNKRLGQAQQGLTEAQAGLSKAQQWLEEKKGDLRNANGAFDSAIARLEETKRQLEKAKGPYYDALRKLENAQKNVNNLCRIRTCSQKCIPGTICKICSKKVWGVKVYYPCCSFTSCMFRIPDPWCVAANSLCHAAQKAAYAVLEAAKLFVRVPVLAFDAAKALVSVAQIAVDKSRVVLSLAEGVLTLAQNQLEGVKGVLDVAKVAIEAVKVSISAALRVVNLVLEYGLKQLLDVRNCEFSMELFHADSHVFDITCEVKAFKMDWQKFGIHIDFKNIYLSLMQFAKATIDALIDRLNLLSGRSSREISFKAMSKMHSLFRQTLPFKSHENSTQYLSEVIDTLAYVDDFLYNVNSDKQTRVQHFSMKCKKIETALNFLNETFGYLLEIATEAKTSVDLSYQAKSSLFQYSKSNIVNSLNLESAGISADAAWSDYKITKSQLLDAVEEGKVDLFSDPELLEIDTTLETVTASLDDEIIAIESVQLLDQWLYAMENTTNMYFKESECIRFRDCVYYAIHLLYDLHTYETVPGIDAIQTAISSLEDNILEVLHSSSSNITSTFKASESVIDGVEQLFDMNVFCSKPPSFTAQIDDITAVSGSPVSVTCNASADPAPSFWWIKDGNLVLNEKDGTLYLQHVTMRDTGTYYCIAGNIVTNVTSDEFRLNVVQASEYDSNDPTDSSVQIDVLVAGIVGGCIAVIGTVGTVLYIRRFNTRRLSTNKTSKNNIEKEKCPTRQAADRVDIHM